jgi:hypothetical protein
MEYWGSVVIAEKWRYTMHSAVWGKIITAGFNKRKIPSKTSPCNV